MIAHLLDLIVVFVTGTVSAVGYLGVAFLMTFESACVPIPSEIIMPFSGFLASTGKLTLWGITLAAACGNLLGAVVTYGIGYYGGRPFVLNYGKYFFIREHELHKAEKFFAKWGDFSVFLSRNLPVIRTFISLPAGVARMPFVKFAVYSFVGSLPWCFALAYLGFLLGHNWLLIKEYGHYLDLLAGLIIVYLLAKIVWDYYHNGETK